MGYFLVGVGFEHFFFMSTHVLEQLSFSMLPSILTFDFDSILALFLTFGVPNCLFLGSGKGSKSILGSTHVVEQLSFSMSPSILTFDFYIIFGVILLICKDLMGFF